MGTWEKGRSTPRRLSGPGLRWLLPLLAVLLLAGGLTSGCAGSATTAAAHPHPMHPAGELPDFVRAEPVRVQEAYQFAVANPEVLSEVACYCGCGSMGHTSNYSCYVQEMAAGGAIRYDDHAIGCSICVDITQDTMTLLREGKSVAEISRSIDATYARYGPSNRP